VDPVRNILQFIGSDISKAKQQWIFSTGKNGIVSCCIENPAASSILTSQHHPSGFDFLFNFPRSFLPLGI
jgi:hypothetical protein